MRMSRYRRTLRFFLGVMLRELFWELFLPKIGLGALTRRTRPARYRKIAASFRQLAIRMGGVLIKVGQFLSARLDVMPREIIAELAGLQDEVDAESFEGIRCVIEAEFHAPLEKVFLEFEPQPVASASIGQVHRARLAGTVDAPHPVPVVVVKVQRPRIEEIVEADLAAIRAAGGWLRRIAAVRRRANVPALIEEFSRTTREEIDYLREGKNAERFAANFEDDPLVTVPTVVWSHTTRRVLTLQDVSAIKITDYAAIDAAGIDRREVARRLFDTYLKQVFEDGFFHADPHPGNLFVQPGRERRGSREWKLVFVDFGMTGTLAPGTFSALRESLVALGTRDAPRMVRSFEALNLLLPGADRDLIERACRRLFETLWGKSTREMMRMSRDEFQRFTEEFGELLYEMPFQVPENLIFLGRCVSILSGMAIGLDPDFAVWEGMAPYVQRLVEKDGQRGVRLILRQLAEIAQLLLALPRRLDSLTERMERGELEVRIPELRQQVLRLERGVHKLAGAIVFSAGLVAATELYLGGRTREALGLGIAEVVLLLWVLFGR